jgi:hypothetical protein
LKERLVEDLVARDRERMELKKDCFDLVGVSGRPMPLSVSKVEVDMEGRYECEEAEKTRKEEVDEEKLGLGGSRGGRGRVSAMEAREWEAEWVKWGRRVRRFVFVGVGVERGMEEALAEREWRFLFFGGVKRERERKERGDVEGWWGMSSSSTRS